MPPRRLVLTVSVGLALVAASALAQTPRPAARRVTPVPAAAADPVPAAPAPPAATSAAPPATGLTGLTGLKPVGDAAPACRAQCAKDRYVCAAGDDAQDCSGRWTQCLRQCATP